MLQKKRAPAAGDGERLIPLFCCQAEQQEITKSEPRIQAFRTLYLARRVVAELAYGEVAR